MMMQVMRMEDSANTVRSSIPEQILQKKIGPKSKCTLWCHKIRHKLREEHGYQCKLCKVNKGTMFHHKIPNGEGNGRGMHKRYKDYKDNNNILLVCKRCHKLIHKVMT